MKPWTADLPERIAPPASTYHAKKKRPALTRAQKAWQGSAVKGAKARKGKPG